MRTGCGNKNIIGQVRVGFKEIAFRTRTLSAHRSADREVIILQLTLPVRY